MQWFYIKEINIKLLIQRSDTQSGRKLFLKQEKITQEHK